MFRPDVVKVITGAITSRLSAFRAEDIEPLAHFTTADPTHHDIFNAANRFVLHQIFCQFWETITMVYHAETPYAIEKDPSGEHERSLYGFAIHIIEQSHFTFNQNWLQAALRRVIKNPQISERVRRYQVSLDSLTPTSLHQLVFTHLYCCHNCCEVTTMSSEELTILNGFPRSRRIASIDQLERWLQYGKKFPRFYILEKADLIRALRKFLKRMKTVDTTRFNYARGAFLDTAIIVRKGHEAQKIKREEQKQITAANRKRKLKSARKELDDADDDVQHSEQSSTQQNRQYEFRRREPSVETAGSESDEPAQKRMKRTSRKRIYVLATSSSEEDEEESDRKSSSSSCPKFECRSSGDGKAKQNDTIKLTVETSPQKSNDVTPMDTDENSTQSQVTEEVDDYFPTALELSRVSPPDDPTLKTTIPKQNNTKKSTVATSPAKLDDVALADTQGNSTQTKVAEKTDEHYNMPSDSKTSHSGDLTLETTILEQNNTKKSTVETPPAKLNDVILPDTESNSTQKKIDEKIDEDVQMPSDSSKTSDSEVPALKTSMAEPNNTKRPIVETSSLDTGGSTADDIKRDSTHKKNQKKTNFSKVIAEDDDESSNHPDEADDRSIFSQETIKIQTYFKKSTVENIPKGFGEEPAVIAKNKDKLSNHPDESDGKSSHSPGTLGWRPVIKRPNVETPPLRFDAVTLDDIERDSMQKKLAEEASHPKETQKKHDTLFKASDIIDCGKTNSSEVIAKNDIELSNYSDEDDDKSSNSRETVKICTDISTEAQTKPTTFEWTINNFSQLPEAIGTGINSPLFYAENKEETWQIQFYPRGQKNSTENYSSIYLQLSSGTLPIKVQCEFLLILSGIVVETRRLIHRYDALNGWGYINFVERSRLISPTTDTFMISCKINKLLENTPTSNPSIAVPQELPVGKKTGRWTEDFAELLQNPKLSDVTIVVEDQEFPVHKVVLAARSPVFAAMFENKKTNASKTKEIKIKKMEPAVVKGMLEFIYTDNVSNLDKMSVELLAAADKYDLILLRTLCEERLGKTLSNETAVEMLVLADLHHCDDLKKRVMDFMDTHLAGITDSKKYIQLEKHPKLLMEFFRFMAAQRNAKKS